MPYGLGKTVKIAVFASENRREELINAGADIFGDEKLLNQVKATP
jgi:ribosomal protein L1